MITRKLLLFLSDESSLPVLFSFDFRNGHTQYVWKKKAEHTWQSRRYHSPPSSVLGRKGLHSEEKGLHPADSRGFGTVGNLVLKYMTKQIIILIPRQNRKRHFVPSSWRIIALLHRVQTVPPQIKLLQWRHSDLLFAVESSAPKE